MWKTAGEVRGQCLPERQAHHLKDGIDCGQRCQRLWIPKRLCSVCPLKGTRTALVDFPA
jgi:hypothetical protein